MIKSDEGKDGPIGRNFRSVHLWDCLPAFTGRNKTEVAVAALTLVTADAVVLPFSVELNDVQQLVEKLVGVLQHFRHPGAKELLERLAAEGGCAGDLATHPPPTARRDPSWGKVTFDEQTAIDDPQSSYEYHQRPRMGGIPVTGVIMQVCYRARQKPVGRETYGGYYSGERRMVMYRCFGEGSGGKNGYFDTVGRVGSNNTYVVECGVTDSHLRLADWGKFAQLPAGAKFKIENTIWTKMSLNQLRRLLHNRVLTTTSY